MNNKIFKPEMIIKAKDIKQKFSLNSEESYLIYLTLMPSFQAYIEFVYPTYEALFPSFALLHLKPIKGDQKMTVKRILVVEGKEVEVSEEVYKTYMQPIQREKKRIQRAYKNL